MQELKIVCALPDQAMKNPSDGYNFFYAKDDVDKYITELKSTISEKDDHIRELERYQEHILENNRILHVIVAKLDIVTNHNVFNEIINDLDQIKDKIGL